MTSDELERRCSALFGPHWQTAFARHSGVDARTVRRWKASTTDVPPWVPVLLHAWETLRAAGIDW
jgi:hypothetical protein